MSVSNKALCYLYFLFFSLPTIQFPKFLKMFLCSDLFRSGYFFYWFFEFLIFSRILSFFNSKYFEKSSNHSVPPIFDNVSMLRSFRKLTCLFCELIFRHIFLGFSNYGFFSRISTFLNSKYLEKVNWYPTLDNEQNIFVSGYNTTVVYGSWKKFGWHSTITEKKKFSFCLRYYCMGLGKNTIGTQSLPK